MADCEIKEQADNCPAARGAAKSAVKDVFAILGVNVDDPAAVEEFRKSLRFGDALRKAADKSFIAFAIAVVGMVIAALVAGVKVKLGG